MRKRRWEFMFDNPYYFPPMAPPDYHERSPKLSLQQAMEAKAWWEHMEKSLKKDEKKDDKKNLMQNGMNMFSVLLLLVGTSPIVALIYKFAIIPALLK